MNSHFDNIVFFDIKTSNLSPHNGEILEIAAIKFIDKKTSYFHRLIKNTKPIKKTILSTLPNLQAIDLAKAKEINVILDDFNLFINDLNLVSHNASFKKEFLEIAYFQNNMIFKNKTLDTLELIALLEPYHKEYTLKTFTQKELGVPFINRATENVEYTIKIVNSLLNKNDIGSFISMYEGLLRDWLFTPYLDKFHIENEFMKPKKNMIVNTPKKEKTYKLKFVAKCESILKNEEEFKKVQPNYKYREAQFNVMKNVRETLEKNNISIIEAPTGTGKSVAYLLPSILKAYTDRKKIFISTNTKELQRQLVTKDIPFLLKTFDLENKVDFVNIKGKGNYLCPEILDDIMQNTIYDQNKSTIEKLAIIYLHRYSSSGEYGDLEEINYYIKEHFNLESILHFCSSDSDGCDIKKCHKKCFYKNTVEKLKDSNIVVLNHSLLLKWSYDDEIQNVIIDEAHNLSDSIFNAYANSLNAKELKKLLLEILDYEKNKGYINYVWRFARNRNLKFREILRDKIKVAFNTLDRVPYIALKGLNLEYNLDTTFNSNYENFNDIKHELLVLREDLLDIHKDLKTFVDTNNLEDTNAKNRAEVLIKKIDRLEEYINFIEIYTMDQTKSNCYGFYCDISKRGFEAYLKDLNSPLIFFEKFLKSTTSCTFLSATLKNKGKYEVFKKSLAIDKIEDKYVNEVLAVKNTFDLKTRSIVATPTDAPRYFDLDFNKYMVKLTLDTLERVPGNLLILFTSKKRLENFKEKISLFLASKNIKLYTGKRDIDKLQNTNERSVLLGSKGFFEGIDIPGDALSCVLMDKLPIINPTDPLFEKLMLNGKSFEQINTPRVITTFKQCFGRLIRTELDYGYFIVIDTGTKTRLWSELAYEYPDVQFKKLKTTSLVNSLPDKFLEWNILNMNIIINSTINQLKAFLMKQRTELNGDSLKLVNSINKFYKIELCKKKLNQNIVFNYTNRKLLAIYEPLNKEIVLQNKRLVINTIKDCFK